MEFPSVAQPEISPEFQRQLASKFDFQTTIETLKNAIVDADMMVLSEIDTQGVLKKAGLEIPGLRQILYFHPRFMRAILQSNPNAVIEAPLKFVARELDDKSVVVHYIAPSYLWGRYAHLNSLGEDLESTVNTIAASIS